MVSGRSGLNSTNHAAAPDPSLIVTILQRQSARCATACGHRMRWRPGAGRPCSSWAPPDPYGSSGEGGTGLPRYTKPVQQAPYPPDRLHLSAHGLHSPRPDTVGVHGRVLHIPDYEHRLDLAPAELRAFWRRRSSARRAPAPTSAPRSARTGFRPRTWGSKASAVGSSG